MATSRMFLFAGVRFKVLAAAVARRNRENETHSCLGINNSRLYGSSACFQHPLSSNRKTQSAPSRSEIAKLGFRYVGTKDVVTRNGHGRMTNSCSRATSGIKYCGTDSYRTSYFLKQADKPTRSRLVLATFFIYETSNLDVNYRWNNTLVGVFDFQVSLKYNRGTVGQNTASYGDDLTNKRIKNFFDTNRYRR